MKFENFCFFLKSQLIEHKGRGGGVFSIWWELLFLFSHQKWSKLGTLLQTDAIEAEMKKDIVLTVYFDDHELN